MHCFHGESDSLVVPHKRPSRKDKVEGRVRSEAGKRRWVGRQDSSRPEADLFPMGTEPLTLQAKICCWNEGDGGFNSFWNLSLKGPKIFHIDSNTKKGPEMDS